MRFSFDSTPIPIAPSQGLPPLPNGVQLELAVPGLHIGLGGKVWPAAGSLCRWLRDEPLDDKHVLEIGCGVGGVGLYAAALGAKSVLLTDGGGHTLLQAAASNIKRLCTQLLRASLFNTRIRF